MVEKMVNDAFIPSEIKDIKQGDIFRKHSPDTKGSLLVAKENAQEIPHPKDDSRKVWAIKAVPFANSRPDRVTITSTVDTVRFHNDKTGYTVFTVKDGCAVLTVVCTLPYCLPENQAVTITGNIVQDKKYGKQLKALLVEFNDPATPDGVLLYLSSGVIAGIGPSTARNIVALFGEKSLEILDNDPAQLMQVEGIGIKTLEKIVTSWKDKREGATVIAGLCRIGLSTTFASRVYKKLGSNSLPVVRENPYRLAQEISGMGFKRADSIANRMGFHKEHPFRIKSGILHTLQDAQTEGHCFLPEDQLLGRAAELLGVAREAVKRNFSGLVHSNTLSIRNGDSLKRTPFGHPVYYLAPVYHAEKAVEQRLRFMAGLANRNLRIEPDLPLTEEQHNAAVTALSNGISIICGSAGTGKTTTLRAIIACLENNNIRYCLCAPTGKAAKRITEVTKRDAQTIHRLIRVGAGSFMKRDERNPIPVEYVICDESSMLDIFLLADLLKALPPNCRLITIGDEFQLPPVNSGAPFRDMIASGEFPMARLTKIQRQQDRSSIISVANAVKDGKMPVVDNKHDTYLFVIEEPTSIAAKIVELATKKIPEKFGIPFNDIQVLAPVRMGETGVDNLNRIIQQAVHPPGAPSLKGFRLHARVIHTENNYKKMVFNGEVGCITELDMEERRLRVAFDGLDSTVEYEYSELEQLDHAFCMSVHRSQGSEFPAVIMPVTSHIMIRPDLLYTAFTRARKLLVIVGTKKALALGIKRRDRMSERFSGLFQA